MVNTTEEQATAQQEEQAPRGRAAMLAMYKTRNPESSDEPDDDALFDWAGKGYADHDEIKGKYDHLNKSNETLATAVGDVPLLAKWLAGISNGENPWLHLGRILGPQCENLDEEACEQLRQGQEEFKARFKQVEDNFNNYQTELDKYCAANKVDDQMKSDIDDIINDMADAMADRVIPPELIKVIHDGLNSQNVLAEAEAVLAEAEAVEQSQIDAAKTAGANEAITGMRSKQPSTSPIPDMGVTSKIKPDGSAMRKRFNDIKPKEYSDKLEIVKNK